MTAFVFATFLCAFLLFGVQPVIARFILPWFGGSAWVWITCVLFFQVMLLAGYLYAHVTTLHLSPRRQVLAHVAIIVVSLLFLPIAPDEGWKPTADGNLAVRILVLLLASVGLPYAVLASTAPLLQRWLHIRRSGPSPYRLYAVSNAGSFLALLGYPLVFEPLLDVRQQSAWWSALYGLAVVLLGACALPVLRRPVSASAPVMHDEQRLRASGRPAATGRGLWFLASACGSVLLLSVTNEICQDIAVVPLLWVFPLALYLLSFVVCFGADAAYDRRVWVPSFIVTCGWVVFLQANPGYALGLNIVVPVASYCLVLFAGCMVCHGELVRSRPHPSRLTGFYLMVAGGGALGGVLVGLLAPYVFHTGYWELHVGLAGTYVLLRVSALGAGGPPSGVGARWSHRWARWLWLAGGVVLAVVFAGQISREQRGVVAAARNFHGIVRVSEATDSGGHRSRTLLHGRIKHGIQPLDAARRRAPVAYYGPDSGIGVAIRGLCGLRMDDGGDSGGDGRRLNVGVIGLGVGSIAAYGAEIERLRFYEINPQVIEFATDYFHYLGESDSAIEIAMGDGRLTLERELRQSGPQRFDILVVDAFSGDAIPVHLLTREALELYWRHLQPQGVLAMHITNQHVDLTPIVRGFAADTDREAVWIPTVDREEDLLWAADWVLVSNNVEFLRGFDVARMAVPWPEGTAHTVTWTDAYSNILSVLR